MATKATIGSDISVTRESLITPLTDRYLKSTKSQLKEKSASAQEVNFMPNTFAKGFQQRPILLFSEMVKAGGHEKTVFNKGLDTRKFIDFVGGPGATSFGVLAARG